MKNTPTVVSREELPGHQLKLVVDLPAELVSGTRAAAVRELASAAEFKGFRPGQAPESAVVAKFGERAVADASVEVAVRRAFPDVLAAEKIIPLVPPSVTAEPAEGGTTRVTATITLFPRVTLPNYRKISEATERRAVEVSEEEVSTEIDRVRKSRRSHAHSHQGGENCEGCLDDAKPLDPLTDEEARSLGPVENVADLREKVRGVIQESKEARERNRRRQAIIEALVAAADAKLPEVVVERELDRISAEFASSLSQVGLTTEQYLAEAKRTAEDLRAERRAEAERRAAAHLLLPMIAAEEKLVVNPELVKSEAEALLARAPGASREDVLAYVEHLVRNELVLSFLEELGAKK